jgi:hypothetical protein
MIINLIKDKKELEVCSSDRVPESLQLEDVIMASRKLEGKKSLQEFTSEDEKVLERWREVFSNRIALGLSFRTNITKFTTQFLQPSADFDWKALEVLVELCSKCLPFKRVLSDTLVRMKGHEWSTDLEGKTGLETKLNVRWLLIVLELPGIYDTKNMLLLCRVLDKLIGIKKETADVFLNWVNEYSKERFSRLVIGLRNILANLVMLFIKI